MYQSVTSTTTSTSFINTTTTTPEDYDKMTTATATATAMATAPASAPATPMTTSTIKTATATGATQNQEQEPEKEQRPLAALSSTLSASSSLSGSTQHQGNSPPMSSTRFKHYTKPTVLDSPQLVNLCQKYIEDNNIEGLARIARNRGLPPAYRQYAWPLLLQSHPDVLNPSIIMEYPNEDLDDDSKVAGKLPIKRIQRDLDRIRKKRAPRPTVDNTGNNSKVISTRSTPTGSSSPTGSTYSTYSSETMGQAISHYFSQTMEDQKYDIIYQAIVKFLNVYGDVVQYETAIAYVACELSDWVNPVYEMAQAVKNGSQSSSPDLTPLVSWEESKSSAVAPFETVYYNLMLMLLHAPTRVSVGPSGPCDSHFTERISDFLSALRNTEPELAKHFDEEDVWSAVGGEEWLLYWIKWCGSRAWKSEDRARFWDMYMGWRPHQSADCDELTNAGIGSDPFWNPVELDSTEILDWHTQHKFICIALLKSHKNVLLELDQSEVRQFLKNFGKNSDLESIVNEAGDLWRSWHWNEERDDKDEDEDK